MRSYRSTLILVLVTKLAICALVIVTTTRATFAQSPAGDSADGRILDPFDPFDLGDTDTSSATDDLNKSAEELLRDATNLLISERPLDARTKLLRALQKDPNLYRTHYLLSGYYLIHVGHFRLAMKYIKRAEELFEKEHGSPPYSDYSLQNEHSNILYYQSQIKLSLDNYKGALESLDRFAKLGYSSEWYPGSRAWILMKMGDINEAIKVARAGILAGAEPGRTLNMLGILLSMSGQRQEALDVFRKAIANEFSAGSTGQPATPLNNSGEVFKELFEDDKAESAFLRATSLPDGCEHVLPSLNLSLMYIDQLNLDAASATLDAFERCVAQFPLRNNEEHVALVHLARGRIDLHGGNVDGAITHFRSAMDGTQWFGKIGTNQNDLVVAATISLAQALTRKNKILALTVPSNWNKWLTQYKARFSISVEAWWNMRRARQILLGELNDLEDLTIRNTDSLIEYPTLGEVLSGLSRQSLTHRLAKETSDDSRAPAKLFYQLYRAERRQAWWQESKAKNDLDDVIERARPRYDELLKTHAILLRLNTLSNESKRYRDLAYQIFFTSPAELRNYGFKLPVYIDSKTVSSALRRVILKGPFIAEGSGEKSASKMEGAICSISSNSSGESLKLKFSCPQAPSKDRLVEDNDQAQLVNKLSTALFTTIDKSHNEVLK